MLERKIQHIIEKSLKEDNKIICIDGARQIGKSYIVRYVCQKLFKNYIEINLVDDLVGQQLFKNIKSIDEFYLQVSINYGHLLGDINNTIIFLDEIQVYPHLLTLLKPLRKDNKYRYICSGSQLGIALSNTTLIPMGSIHKIRMYPLDFEEFLLANSVGKNVINHMKESYTHHKALSDPIHNRIMSLFKTYLFVGGLPDAVNAYIETKNVVKIREVQSETQEYYGDDASKYDSEHKLKIKRIYDLVPSNIENKVKRIKYSDIEEKPHVRYIHYAEEFDYLIESGIVLAAKAISEPKFPLIQSSSKNLIKLYVNDVGVLSNVLYKNNINAILDDQSGVNLGAIYETVVAQELKAHGHELFYFDRKKLGEVDFLIDDYDHLCPLPIEIKSGKDFMNFRALPKLIDEENYHIDHGIVMSNSNDIKYENHILYLPIYYVMFI